MALQFDPTKAKVVRRVTLPLLKWEDEKPAYIVFMTPIFKGKELKGTKEGAIMEPADLANVVNLLTGEESQIIVNAVLHSQLRENYTEKNSDYVGRAFMIVRHKKAQGKRYNEFTIAEIENPLGDSLSKGKAQAPKA